MSGPKNGEKPPRPHTVLELVEERIATRLAIEGDMAAVSESSPFLAEEPGSVDVDPLRAWRRRDPGRPITLEQIHTGLIATCEYSEAAIEAGIRMAADVRDVVRSTGVRDEQLATIAAKVESNNDFINKVDDDVAAQGKTMNEVRRDVQHIKDEIREIKDLTKQIPAIKDLLGEILARLPDPSSKPAP